MIRLRKSDLFIRPERVSAVIVEKTWDGLITSYKLVIDGKIVIASAKDKDTLVEHKLIIED